MGFQVSKTAAGIASGGGGGTGGYLTAGKLGDGDHYRVAIVSEDPLEYWTLWAETDEGQKKPFRFTSEPSADDIHAELGDDWKQRMNYEGTALEAPKFGMSFFVFDFADSKIKVFEMTQKTLIKELDKLCNDDDYSEIAAWDLKINRTGLKMNTEYSILPSPRKKGSQDQIDAAWKVAQDQGYDINQLLVGGNPFGEKL